MIEIKCETIEDEKIGPLRRATILVNGQPAWAQEALMSAAMSENEHDLSLLTWLWNAIRQQQTEIDVTISEKIRELKGLRP